MTKEMPTPTDDPRFDWVTARADCTIEAIYRDLVDLVKRDIQRVHRAPARLRRNKRFTHENGRYFVVSRFDETVDDGAVSFRLGGEGIEICRDDRPLHRISLRWDRGGAQCCILKDGEPCRLWQVSEAALYPLFFDD